VIETKGLKVVIDAMSVPYIMGSEFDYVDGLMGAGFAVNNPNVRAAAAAAAPSPADTRVAQNRKGP
jgi:Fe-S cluster assembly iron-binding protein IscA